MVWQIGQKLQGGKYEIIKILGRGGFGITYHARHITLNTEVVIKTPDILQQKDIEYEQYVQQFQNEAQRLAKFSTKPHPHIVKVRDYFLEDTLPCLVMDFIRGQTLMEIIKTQGRLSEEKCLVYIRQIGKALETIHQAEMVHRDAHPGNIMIQDGEAILIDFGIARNIIPATHSNTSNAANPSFAPYEQIYLGSKERQYTIDVYTLAATFYYAVTGKRPTPSMERKLNDKSILIPPKQIHGQLSEHINEAILEGMALEKEDRPQSISVWLGLLETNNLARCSNKSRQILWISLITLFLIFGIYGLVILMTQYLVWTVISEIGWIGWLLVLPPAFPLLMSLSVALTNPKPKPSAIWKEMFQTWDEVKNPEQDQIMGLLFLTMPWVMATAWTGTKLEQENFSRFHQFLILSGVSLGSMVLGYLIGWLFSGRFGS